MTVPARLRRAEAVLGAVGRYELRIADEPVAHGPGPYHQRELTADLVDLTQALAPWAGARVRVEFLVLDPALDLGWAEQPRGPDATLRAGGHGLLLLDLDGELVELPAWPAAPAHDWALDTMRVNPALGWIEHRRVPAPAPQGSPTAQAAPPFPTVTVRPRAAALAPWAGAGGARLRRPARIILAGLGSRQAPPPPQEILNDVRGVPLEVLAGAEGLVGGVAWEVTTGGRDVHLLVDLGQVWTGSAHVSVDAPATIDVATSEDLDRGGRLAPDDIGSRLGNRLIGPRAWQMDPGGARFLHVVVREPGPRVRVNDVGLVCVPTPAREGSFACDDERLTAVWEAGARTVEGAWGDMLVADPGREQHAWVGDLHVGLRTARTLWAEPAYSEGERFLRRIADLARPDGSLPRFAPGDVDPSYPIPDYALGYLLALREHAEAAPTGEALAAGLGGTVAAALRWFDRWLGSDGVVRDVAGWRFVDWGPVRTEGASLVYTALRREVGLAYGLRLPDARAATGLFASPHRPAWRDVAHLVQVSETANAHAVLAGLLSGEAARAALQDVVSTGVVVPRFAQAPEVARLLDPDRQALAAQPYQSAFLLDALAACGLHGVAVDLVRSRWGALAAQAPTMGELWDGTGSRCHSWSSGPTPWLTRHVLGLRHRAPAEVEVAPARTGVESAEGALPTAAGPVWLAWRRSGAGRRGQLEVPDGVRARLVSEGTPPVMLGPGRHDLRFP